MVVVLEDEEEVLVLGTDVGTVALLHPDAGAAWFHLPQHRRLPTYPTCAPVSSAYSLVSSNFRREMIKYNSTSATMLLAAAADCAAAGSMYIASRRPATRVDLKTFLII